MKAPCSATIILTNESGQSMDHESVAPILATTWIHWLLSSVFKWTIQGQRQHVVYAWICSFVFAILFCAGCIMMALVIAMAITMNIYTNRLRPFLILHPEANSTQHASELCVQIQSGIPTFAGWISPRVQLIDDMTMRQYWSVNDVHSAASSTSSLPSTIQHNDHTSKSSSRWMSRPTMSALNQLAEGEEYHQEDDHDWTRHLPFFVDNHLICVVSSHVQRHAHVQCFREQDYLMERRYHQNQQQQKHVDRSTTTTTPVYAMCFGYMPPNFAQHHPFQILYDTTNLG